MSWWMWLLLGFFLLLMEMVTPGGFYLLFFGVAAIIVGLLAGLNVAGPLWLQWLLFSILSVLAVLVFRRPLLRKTRPALQGREVDTLVGETAVALQEIAADGVGKVELRGTSWNARNLSAAPVKTGDRCTVEHVEGLMLHIRGK